MARLRACVLIFVVCIGTASAAGLAGLWTAKGRFGPDARGPLILHKNEDGFRADMLGRDVPVREQAGELVFELPWTRAAMRLISIVNFDEGSACTSG